MTSLGSIRGRGLRQVGRLDVELGGSSLVLLGPSGSGKSALLGELMGELEASLAGRTHPADRLEAEGAKDRELRMAYLGRPLRLGWEGDPAADFARGRLVALALDDARSGEPVEGPLDPEPRLPRERVFGQLEGLLVDRWLRKGTSGAVEARVHEAWLFGVQQTLRTILGEAALRLAIQPPRCRLDIGEGRRPGFDELPRGQREALSLFAEVFLRVEGARLRAGDPALDPHGLVVIDGAEAGLDARQQRELLPALSRTFGRLQWVVATHSPLLALSLDDAVVVDLGRGRQTTVAALRQEGLERLSAAMIGLAPRPRETRPPPPKRPPPAKLPRARGRRRGRTTRRGGPAPDEQP